MIIFFLFLTNKIIGPKNTLQKQGYIKKILESIVSVKIYLILFDLLAISLAYLYYKNRRFVLSLFVELTVVKHTYSLSFHNM